MTEEYLEDIGKYMSSPVSSIDSELTVQEAAQQMHAKNVGALLVRVHDKFVGILTETDLTRKVIAKGLNTETTFVSSIQRKVKSWAYFRLKIWFPAIPNRSEWLNNIFPSRPDWKVVFSVNLDKGGKGHISYNHITRHFLHLNALHLNVRLTESVS